MAMQNRPLRDFEKGAHLHVLDWAHETARYRLQAAGAAQVKAAARAIAKGEVSAVPRLPALEAAIVHELRKLYALGHATVRSELDHQRTRSELPIGLSAAPEPPNLRKAKAKKGKAPSCGTCKMYDPLQRVCWGYGNWPVKPNQLCDSYAPDTKPKQLARREDREPGQLRARGRLVAEATASAIWQAVQRARLQGLGGRRARRLGEAAGQGALKAAASSHAGGAINAGRRAAAGLADDIIGARYTSVLDKNTCGPCRDSDDGVLRALDDPALAATPNPDCEGGDRCRCLLVYQTRAEGMQVGDFSAAELGLIKRGAGG